MLLSKSSRSSLLLAGSVLLGLVSQNGPVSAFSIPEVVFRPGPSSELGTKGGIASESLECSEIGRDLLARGVGQPSLCLFTQVNLDTDDT